jgi:uncharacterized protein YqeY
VTSDLKSRLQADLISARKQRDRLGTLLISTTLSEIRNREIETGGPLAEADVVQVIGRAIKQRKDAAEQMRAGGRSDLGDKEELEGQRLSTYLPEPLAEGDVRALAREAIAAGADNLGSVMSSLMPALRGRFDGKEANRIAREELAR